jgi:anaerobic dimethyl sulfoxide reductase subunit C (anchor subunit)
VGAGLFKNSVSLSIWLFIALAAFGMILSTLHLGKPLRAPFSIRNIKTSWLSREILLFGVFAIFGFFSVLFNNYLINVFAVIFGLLFLIAVEMVYSITQKLYKTPIHSANTILTALTFTLLFSQLWSLLLAILVIKALLFIIRNGTLPTGPSFTLVLISFFRLLAGFILPFGMIAFAQVTVFWVLATLLILGELIDRLLFYGDFKPERPFDNINSK